jgi:hypothetical protein
MMSVSYAIQLLPGIYGGCPMIDPANPVLTKMLDRLFASMVNGPSMNCRPHASRQRIDLVQVSRLKNIEPERMLLSLIGPGRLVKLVARLLAAAKAERTTTAVTDKEQEKLRRKSVQRDRHGLTNKGF